MFVKGSIFRHIPLLSFIPSLIVGFPFFDWRIGNHDAERALDNHEELVAWFSKLDDRLALFDFFILKQLDQVSEIAGVDLLPLLEEPDLGNHADQFLDVAVFSLFDGFWKDLLQFSEPIFLVLHLPGYYVFL